MKAFDAIFENDNGRTLDQSLTYDPTQLGLGFKLLREACKQLRVKHVEVLLNHGLHPDITYHSGCTVLQFLIHKSMNVEEEDKKLLPLYFQLIRLLLEYGADFEKPTLINISNGGERYTMREAALVSRIPEWVELAEENSSPQNFVLK